MALFISGCIPATGFVRKTYTAVFWQKSRRESAHAQNFQFKIPTKRARMRGFSSRFLVENPRSVTGPWARYARQLTSILTCDLRQSNPQNAGSPKISKTSPEEQNCWGTKSPGGQETACTKALSKCFGMRCARHGVLRFASLQFHH